jgi:PAS domain-containing protein
MRTANPLDDAACGLVEVAADGQIVAANAAFAEIVDRVQAALPGMRIQTLLTRGSALFYETQFSPSLLLRGSLEEISLELLRTERGFRCSSTPFCGRWRAARTSTSF